MFILEGRGRTLIDGVAHPWEGGDVLNLPLKRDGIIVQQEPTSIASALIDLLIHKDQRIAMGKAGQARAESDFSWKTIAADVERGYRVPEAIGAGQRRRHSV